MSSSAQWCCLFHRGFSTHCRSATPKRTPSACRRAGSGPIVVVFATLGTAAAVAVSGLIAFVGLIVPHTVRLLVGASYRTLLPLSAVFGAAFLILADLAARTIASPAELPIGVITAFVGAPFFGLILRTSKRVIS